MGKLSVDKELIRELAELLDETGLTEIEVEEDDTRIRIARSAGPVIATAAPAPAATPVAGPGAPDEAASHPGAVKSPMVGTAYLAPEPGAAPFIQEGQRVEAGQTLLIIEAMKTMNPVTAPRAGTVAKILIANEQPVEYGEPLVILE